MKWNHTGTLIAISGKRNIQGSVSTCVAFYNSLGEEQYCLKVPGQSITAISWELSGYRISIACDSFVYFANVKGYNQFAYLSSDMVLLSKTRKEKDDQVLVSWNLNNKTKNVKYSLLNANERILKHAKTMITFHDRVLLAFQSANSRKKYRFTHV